MPGPDSRDRVIVRRVGLPVHVLEGANACFLEKKKWQRLRSMLHRASGIFKRGVVMHRRETQKGLVALGKSVKAETAPRKSDNWLPNVKMCCWAP